MYRMQLHLRRKDMRVPHEIKEVEYPKGIMYAYGKNPIR